MKRRSSKKRGWGLLIGALMIVAAFAAAGFCLGFFCGRASASGPAETVTDGAYTSSDSDTALTSARAPLVRHTIENVEYISQFDRYPTGCEAVSAVMALRYAGFDITVDDFIDNYLDMGDTPTYDGDRAWGADPWEQFVGSPYSPDGYGCYSPVIKKAAERIVGDGYTVEDCGGLSLEELCRDYIDNDIPVLLWATIDMAPPSVGQVWYASDSGREIEWVIPMHCLLLVGYDEDGYCFNDPHRGEYVFYGKAECETAYAAQHSQALTIRRL